MSERDRQTETDRQTYRKRRTFSVCLSVCLSERNNTVTIYINSVRIIVALVMVGYTHRKGKVYKQRNENKTGNEDQIQIKQREKEQHVRCFETFAIRVTDDAGLT